jgi:hypothetical protein
VGFDEARLFDKMTGEIENDLGGRDRLSTIARTLVEAYVGAALTMHNLNVRLALGQDIDPGTYGSVVSSMVRVASRLGVQRVARDVTPSVKDYIRHLNEQDEEDGA